ncbi:MAG: RNA polymerase sigma factor [Nannocystales bacterium]
MSGEPPDRVLFEDWAQGDAAAGDALLRRHFESLFRFFSNKLDSEIEDMLQTTMLRCVEHRERFAGHSSFRTYLFSIARNLLIDRIRQRYGPRGAVDFTEVSLADLGTSPSQAVLRDERRRAVCFALRRLPLDYQIPIELAYWENLNATEIGEVLNVSPATVRTRLRRARQRLGSHLGALAAEP